MRKLLLIFLFGILVCPFVFSMNLTVEKMDSDQIMIPSLDLQTSFKLKISNDGVSGNFYFINLLGFEMSPNDIFYIKQAESKEIDLKISSRDLDYRGIYILKYKIVDENSERIERDLNFRLVDLEDAFEVGSEDFNSDSGSLKVYVKNKYNFDFGDVDAKFSSSFFNLDESFFLGAYETKSFDINLDREEFKELIAGFYTFKVEIKVQDEKANIEGILKFSEAEELEILERDYGIFINHKIITKENKGNVLVSSETAMVKNILSRLFTTFSPEPSIVKRDGMKVFYTWNNEIRPGEMLEIVARTNWFFPLILIALIIMIVIFVKIYTGTDLVLRKKVNFVHAKGGEFALKVSVFVSAKRYIENVNIIDRLPALVKVHERFGSEKPKRIDEKMRKIEWGFDKLEKGEKRVLTYIIYSKIGVVGKFALPSATAIFDKEGKIKEAESNRAFFVSEAGEFKKEN